MEKTKIARGKLLALLFSISPYPYKLVLPESMHVCGGVDTLVRDIGYL